MKNLIYKVFIITIFQFAFLFSQTTTPFLINNYTDDDQESPSFVRLNNGNIFAFWQSYGQNGTQNHCDLYASIFDLSGNEIVTDFLVTDSIQADDFYPVSCKLNNGNIIVCWVRAHNSSFHGYIMVKVFDQLGNSLTNEFFINDTSNGNPFAIAGNPYCISLNNGGYIVAYNSWLENDIYIVYFDSNNNFLSSFKFNSNFHSGKYNIRLTQLINGNIIICFEKYDQNDDGVFYRILDLNIGFITDILQANIYNIDDQEKPDIISLSNGNFAITWISDSDSTFSFCRIFDVMGTALTDELRGDSEVDLFGEVRLLQNSNNMFFMVYDGSYISDTKLLSRGYYLDGSIARQEHIYFNDFQNWVYSFELEGYDQNYDFLIYEDFDGDGHGIFGVYIDSSQTSLKNTNTQHLQEFVLEQNYPNPFNPNTVITYKLPVASNIELTIYNLMGQKVKTLINKKQSAGIYQISWDGYNQNGNQVSSGVYLYCLTIDSFIQSRKMLLLK